MSRWSGSRKKVGVENAKDYDPDAITPRGRNADGTLFYHAKDQERLIQLQGNASAGPEDFANDDEKLAADEDEQVVIQMEGDEEDGEEDRKESPRQSFPLIPEEPVEYRHRDQHGRKRRSHPDGYKGKGRRFRLAIIILLVAVALVVVAVLIGLMLRRANSNGNDARGVGDEPSSGATNNDDDENNGVTISLSPNASPTRTTMPGNPDLMFPASGIPTAMKTLLPTALPTTSSTVFLAITNPPSTSSPSTAFPTTFDPTLVPSTAPADADVTDFVICPLCFDGRDLPDPSARLFPEDPDSSETCGDLQRWIQAAVTNSEDPSATCLEWQALASLRCSCGYPHPQSFCAMCPTLPPPEVLNLTTPFVVNGETYNCFDLLMSAAIVPQNAEPICSDVLKEQWAPFCQCDKDATTIVPDVADETDAPSLTPQPFTCPICWDGSDMLKPEALLFPLNENEPTCRDLELAFDDLVANFVDPEEECLEWQVRASIRCGCPFPHPRAHCTLCPGGVLPPLTVLDTVTPIRAGGGNLTCEDLIWSAAVIEQNQEPLCSQGLLPKWAPYCRCPGFVEETTQPSSLPSLAPSEQPNPSCSVCLDGRSPPNPDALVFPTVENSTLTCGLLQTVLNTIGNDSEECLEFQVRGSIRCGCGFPHPKAHCDICPDGSLPSDAILNSLTPELSADGENLTCADLIFSAATLPSNEGSVCNNAVVPKWAPHCQCPGFETTSTPTSRPILTAVPTAVPVSVPSVESSQEGCTLCADGVPLSEEFRGAFALQTTEGAALTCAELDLRLDEFNDDCYVLQLYGILNCGCMPSPHPDAPCWLCPNGDIPPEDFRELQMKEIGSEGRPLTCTDSYFEAALLRNSTESCRAFQEEYAPRCGCAEMAVNSTVGVIEPSETPAIPTTTNSTAEPSLAAVSSDPPAAESSPLCSLCADGSPSLLTNITVSRSGLGRNSTTCGALEASMETFLETDSENTSVEDLCFWAQVTGALRCGCRAKPASPCWICPDGSVPPSSFLDKVVQVGGVNLTCADAALQVALLETTEDCGTSTSSGPLAKACGCPNQTIT